MKGLIKLAILAAAVYLGYTELLPRYRSFQEAKEAETQAVQEDQQAHHCVSVAESVSKDFTRELSSFARPPVDAALWSTFMLQAGGQLSNADSACRCPHPACISAGAALLEQRKLLTQFDGMVRGASSGISNPAAALERINNLLARARSEAG